MPARKSRKMSEASSVPVLLPGRRVAAAWTSFTSVNECLLPPNVGGLSTSSWTAPRRDQQHEVTRLDNLITLLMDVPAWSICQGSRRKKYIFVLFYTPCRRPYRLPLVEPRSKRSSSNPGEKWHSWPQTGLVLFEIFKCSC